MTLLWILVPTLLYSIFSFIRLNFLNLKSFTSVKDDLLKNTLVSQTDYRSLFSYLLTGVLLVLLLNVSWLGGFTGFNITHLTLLVIVSTLSALKLISFNKSDYMFTPLSTIFSLLSLLLLTSSNLYQLYIILEVLAYTNLLFLTVYGLTAGSRSTSQHIYSIIISFIMNFVASIVLFSGIFLSCWFYGYPTWQCIQLLNSGDAVSLILTLSVLVKLGVGPWLVGNVFSYQGYTLPYLLVYTIYTVVITTPILLYVISFGVQTFIISLTVVLLLLFISQTMHSVTSLKSLFAYSTVIMYIYLMLIFIS